MRQEWRSYGLSDSSALANSASFLIYPPVEPNKQEKQKNKFFLSLYLVPLVLEGLLQVECEPFLKLGRKGLTNLTVISRLPAGKKSRDRLSGDFENIQSWCSRTCGRRGALRLHESTSKQ